MPRSRLGVARAQLTLSAVSRAPGLSSAVLLGACTVLAPWLVLQPNLGPGLFANRSPKPKQTRLLNLPAHLVFGFGLYLGWQRVALAVP
ncbi:MAG: DUF2938 domain-containing protein [Planctomycetes bacterium]|nr:DUF2938 domain-containing protein [Planctomycetota bacterium]